MRTLLLTLSLLTCLTVPATAATAAPRATESSTVKSSTAESSTVIGAVDGTTATVAADRFRAIRTGDRTPLAASIHDDWGVYTSNSPVTGQDAVQAVYDDLSISRDTLYAPTMKAPGACIELVTAYSGSAKQVWAWDWCVGVTVARSVNIDSSFRSNYGTSVNGHDSYRGRVEQTATGSNTWTASLFNYRTGQWDVLYTQSGTDQSRDNRSWNIFEIYASGDTTAEYCNALGSRAIESTGYQIKLDGSWRAADGGNTSVTSNSSAGDFLCPNLSRTVVHANDQWRVRR